jgi:hypothetical protein
MNLFRSILDHGQRVSLVRQVSALLGIHLHSLLVGFAHLGLQGRNQPGLRCSPHSCLRVKGVFRLEEWHDQVLIKSLCFSPTTAQVLAPASRRLDRRTSLRPCTWGYRPAKGLDNSVQNAVGSRSPMKRAWPAVYIVLPTSTNANSRGGGAQAKSLRASRWRIHVARS